MPACLPDSQRRVRAGRVPVWLALCAVAAATSCANWQVPRIDPTGEHILVPPGSAPAAPTPTPRAPGSLLDPVPLSLTVMPSRVSAPIGAEVVLVAGVGTDGFLLTHQRLDWMISAESVGQFISPGVRRPLAILDLIQGLPKKVDARYVINNTLFYPMTLNRGTPTPLDDIHVQSGQAWVTLSSPVEGTTSVTVFAPSVTAWDRRQQVATIHWVDAQWRFPTPAISDLGGRNTLTTALSRQSSGAPLPGWIVRYEITGGPPAGFAPDGATTVDLVTSATGDASVEIFQKQEMAGSNQIAVHVLRPPGAGDPSGPVEVGAGSTTQSWGTGGVAAPAAAGGPNTAPGVATAPPTFGASPPLQPTPAAEPTLPAASPATPPPAGRAELDVTVNGPATATVGGQVQFEVQVINRGTATARNLLVTNRFDRGLRHAAATSPIERDLVDLQPGGTSRLTVSFQAVESGQQCQEVEVTGDEGLRATARACVSVADREVQPPQREPAEPEQPRQFEPPAAGSRPTGPVTLVVRKSGADRRRVGQPVLFTIEVTNTGNTALDDVVIASSFETLLEPQRATDGNEWLDAGALGWKIASLPAGRSARRELELKCLRESPRACNRVTVTAQGIEPVTEEVCLEIIGEAQAETPPSSAPETPAQPSALSVSVADTADPIKVDGETTYQILVENKGEASLFNVAVTAALSDEIKIAGVSGPVQGSVLPGSIRFAPIRELRAGEAPLSYELKVKAVRAGTAKLRVEVASQGQSKAATAEQTTDVLP